MLRSTLYLALFVLAACSGSGGGDDDPITPIGPAPTQPTPTPPAVGTYSVSGTMTVDSVMVSDTDVNDPVARYVANDTSATAQGLSNPGIAGGYVNTPGSGEPGRSRTAGDPRDFYRVDLVAGQSITLNVAEPADGDADLYVWDASGRTLVAFSNGTGVLERVSITTPGQYLIEVEAFSGATNYVLSVGQLSTARGAGMLTSDDEFVAGEAVVRLQTEFPAGAQKTTFDFSAAHAVSIKSGAPDRISLFSLPTSSASGRMKPMVDGPDRETALADSDLRARWVTAMHIKTLRSDARVAYAEPNYVYRTHAIPNDPYYSTQWHYPTINLPGAWETTRGSSSVTVAVIDTGVILNHPDLAGQFVGGFDFIRDPSVARDGDGIDSNPDDPGDEALGGSSFHGTHVAGTIAALSGNALGVAGVAPGVRIMPLRVLGRGGRGSGYDIAQAVLYAAGLPNDSGRVPARPADVINLSLGGPAGSAADQDTYARARRQGVIVVASAGNAGNALPNYPASYPGVISVSSVGLRKTLASYSSYGATVDVAAPGGDSGDFNGDGYVDHVLSTGGDDSRGFRQPNYRFMAGTSMAAPHVAGVIALMKSVNPSLTPDQVDQLLALGRLTTDLGSPGRDDHFGHGLIDARKAVNAAAGDAGPGPAPTLDASPRSLSFGSGVVNLEVLVRNAGGGTLQVTSTMVSHPWISVLRGTSVDVNGLGRYLVTVNRSGLAPGSHSGFVEFRSPSGMFRLPILLEVTTQSRTGDAGLHYVLLLDPSSGESRYQTEVQVERGVYHFRFDGVAAGHYEIYAGTDADNDGFICDEGESCGAFLSLDQPSQVHVSGGTSVGAFAVGFDAAIRASVQSQNVVPAAADGVRRLR